METEDEPMFVMSMFANKETLLEAKCEYLQKRVDTLEEKLVDDTLNTNRREHIVRMQAVIEELNARLAIADPDGETLDILYDDDGNLIDHG